MSLNTLIIDDDSEIHTILRSYLKSGYQISGATTFGQAEALLQNSSFDLVIIDLNLISQNGLDLVKSYKPIHESTKFFILTANEKEQLEIDCHKSLADEYIKKPVSKSLLLAIIDKHFPKKSKTINIGNLRIDESDHKAWMVVEGENENLDLTPIELKLLIKFAKNPGRVFSRDELLLHVWGEDCGSTFRTVDMHVSNLRKKIVRSQVLIETIRAVGYQLNLSTK